MQLSLNREGYPCAVLPVLIFAGALQLTVAAPLSAAVIHVPENGKLQKALDDAKPGDTITLEPGAVYSGTFFLRRKSGNEFITITSSDPKSFPPDGTRITPAYSSHLPKVAASSTSPVFRTEPGAHHYRLIGLEILTPNKYNWDLIRLGSDTATSAALQSSDFVLDRLYIHGDPRLGAKRGVTLNSRSTIIKNCYISDIKGIGQETQAILGYNGPGPFEITNNYLEAAGENIMFGGGLARITGLVPSDIVIRRNHLRKQLSWKRGHPTYAGKRWTVKNLIEFKNARRVTVDSNIFEYSWQDAQMGFAIVLTVRTQSGAMPWAVVEDIIFTRNIIRHCAAGVNILGRDYNGKYLGRARRITFKDNIFEDIDPLWGGAGRLFQILEAAEDITIDHNTFVSNNVRSAVMFDGAPTVRFTYKNNILPHGNSGFYGTGSATGSTTLNRYTRGYTVMKNVLTGAPAKASAYPPGNFFPAAFSDVRFIDLNGHDYRLASNSPYKNGATDGQDIGANAQNVTAATAGTDIP